MAPIKISAVTGSRADWGLLSPPLALIRDDPAFELDLIVTGQHLAAGQGDTKREIEADGFRISFRIDIELASDSRAAITRSMGLALAGFADAYSLLKPDLIFLLGDRYEILAAASAALIGRIPVAHLCGGDLTLGAMDDAIRHAVTKLSHLHFVTNEDSASRVLQLGEDPSRVHCVGSTGLDRLRMATPMPRAAFFAAVGLEPRRRNLLVTFHPETLHKDCSGQCAALLAALDKLGPDYGLIFTGSNADPGAREIDRMITAFVGTHQNARFFASLGMKLYSNALRHVDAVVGNSSSGLYEVPTFRIPTVNIGNRQQGRLRASSVIDCPADRSAIIEAIVRAMGADCSNAVNPYGDGHAAERIVSVLKGITAPAALNQKHFVDWEAP